MRDEIVWERLDVSGTDRCRLTSGGEGHLIEGRAESRDGDVATGLSYVVRCAPDWSTLSAQVEGYAGERAVSFLVQRSAGQGWHLDGVRLDFADDLVDIDLGFTPATNTNAIRRLNLAIGDIAETTALWFDIGDFSFKRLTQVYHRLGPDAYDYVSPAHDYRARLRVDGAGRVLDYPGLWTARGE